MYMSCCISSEPLRWDDAFIVLLVHSSRCSVAVQGRGLRIGVGDKSVLAALCHALAPLAAPLDPRDIAVALDRAAECGVKAVDTAPFLPASAKHIREFEVLLQCPLVDTTAGYHCC